MRVLVVSTRGGPQARTWTECAAEQAARLQSLGHLELWLQVLPAELMLPARQQDLNCRRVDSPRPKFTAIERQLADVPGERALSQELRQDPPDAVHLFGYGNCGSASIPWLCARLGVPAIVSLDLREALCHRGTLIDAAGQTCRRWDDPQRCLDCCLAPAGAGLTPAQARRAKMLRFLGALSPYPKLSSFQNRADIMIGGLAFAQCIIVVDQDAATCLQDLGVAERLIQIDPGPDAAPEDWIELYSTLESS